MRNKGRIMTQGQKGFRAAAVLALAPALVPALVPAAPGRAGTPALDHIDCIAAYALVEWAAPAFLDTAVERALRAVAAQGDGDIRAEAYRRMRERGARMTEAATQDDMIRETDAWMADLNTCDARYGFPPLPQLWID